MKKVELKEIKSSDSPGHFGCSTLRLHNRDTSGCQSFSFSLSHFLPGGGAEMSSGEVERVYYVISGNITVTDSAGHAINLQPTDSIYIGKGEKRGIANNSNLPATILVVASSAK